MKIQRRTRKSLCGLVAFLLTTSALAAQEVGTQAARAQAGILDARQLDFGNNATVISAFLASASALSPIFFADSFSAHHRSTRLPLALGKERG